MVRRQFTDLMLEAENARKEKEIALKRSDASELE